MPFIYATLYVIGLVLKVFFASFESCYHFWGCISLGEEILLGVNLPVIYVIFLLQNVPYLGNLAYQFTVWIYSYDISGFLFSAIFYLMLGLFCSYVALEIDGN